MTATLEDFQKFSKDQLEAFTAASTTFSKGLQEIAAESSDYSKKSFAAGSAVYEKLLGVRSVESAIQIQTEFVKQAIVPKDGRDVTSEELLLCYYKKCERQKWTPVASQTFYTRVPDLLAQMFRTTRRNDIQREGRAVRGFKNVTLAS